MPFEFNNRIVVTRDELVPKFYSWDALRQQITRYKDLPYGITRVQRGCNGRQLLIDFDSLPPEIRDGLGDPRKADHILEHFYKVDSEAVRFYSQFTFEDGTYLELDYQEKYITNASVLKSLMALEQARINERRSKAGKLSGILMTIHTDAVTFQKTLQAKHNVQHTLPESYRRFKKAYNAFKKEGFTSLISKRHKNSNAQKVTEQTIQLLNNIFSGQIFKPTPTDVHREYIAFLEGYRTVINDTTGEVYNPEHFKPLSDRTITNYIAQWSNAIATLTARTDSRKNRVELFPYASTEKADYSGSLLSIDDRQPPFHCVELQNEKDKRIWFYLGVDEASGAYTCWVHGTSKKGIILNFYRQLVRNYHDWGFNLPAELECEMSLNSSFRNTFLREGAMFDFVRVEANKPHGKIIERYFKELRYGDEKKEVGWRGRPGARSEANQTDGNEPLRYYDDIVNITLRALENHNNQPHPEHPEVSRWKYFLENQHPNLNPTNYNAFLPYIGHKTQTSCNRGIIKLNNKEYFLGHAGELATGDKLISLMDKVEGHDLDIYWLDGNDGQIIKALVYYQDTMQLVCEAVDKPKFKRARIEQTPQCHVNLELYMSYHNTIEGFSRTQRAKLDKVIVINEEPKKEKDFQINSLKRYEVDESSEVKILDTHDEEEEMNEEPIRSFVKPLSERY